MWRLRVALCIGALLSSQAAATTLPPKISAGMVAPSFVRADLAGKPVDLRAFRGRIVLLDFWASWCAPCLVEVPHLIVLQKHYRDLAVIGISMDDSAAPVKAVTKRFAFNYPVLMGDAKFGDLYGGIYGLPVHILIGRDGRVLKIWKGELPPETLEGSVRSAIRHSTAHD